MIKSRQHIMLTFYRKKQKGKREGRKGEKSGKEKIILYKKYNKCSITLILLDPKFKSTLFRKKLAPKNDNVGRLFTRYTHIPG